VTELETTWLKGTDQTTQAARVAARALRDSPTSLAVSDDPLVRFEMFQSTFLGMLDGARVAGVRLGGTVLGVAATEHPGNCIASLLPPEFRVLDPPAPEATDADRFLHMGSILAAHDLLEPHWHVGPVSVEPEFQGRGLGRSAMGLLCAEFDQYGRLAWLETDKPENVRFYERFGYAVVAEAFVLRVPNWFMIRRP